MSTNSHTEPPSPARGKQRLLLKVERFSRGHYRWVFLAALAMMVLATWLGSMLRYESNILRMLPRGNRKIDTFKEALRDFGSIDYLLVLLQAGPGEGPDELEDFADVLAGKLGANEDLVEGVEYRFQLDAEFLNFFYDNAVLFLPPERLDDLAANLSDKAIARQVRADLLALASPTAPLSQELILRDPLGLMPLFINRLVGSRRALQVDLSDGYYLSRDGRNLIMLVKPTSGSQDISFCRRLVSAANRDVVETRTELSGDKEEGEAGGASGVQVRLSGNYAMALEESALVRQDVRFNLLFSLFAVSALYWLCYRRFAALLYSSVPLMVGQAMTFAFAFFALGELNASSSAFTALLMGLGTDFTIVMYARYVEERQAGATLAAATERMVGETGLGVFTGAITSAGTFYALCISRFRGLLDLGLLIGSGILFCAVAILFLLPAMITWNEGVRRRKGGVVRKLHLQSFGLEHLIPLAARYRRTVIAATVVLTLVAGYLATLVPFNDSVNALRSHRSRSLHVQHEIAEKFGASLSYMMAIGDGNSLDEAVDLADKVERRLKPFVEDGTVGSYDSLLTYLPPLSQQQEVLRILREDPKGRFDPERIRASFLRALDANGFNREPFVPYLERMERFLRPRHPIRVQDLKGRGLERLVDRYIHVEDGRVRIVTYLFPTDPRWKRRPPPGLEKALTAGDPRIVVTGTNVLGQEMRRLFSREGPRAVAFGLLLVFLLLILDFRSLRLTSIALAQLVSGVVLMLGFMKVLGIEMNYVNSYVAVMILGVGIDYSIHLVHRMHLSGGRVEDGLLETGKAVVMAALTNVAGFGTLMLGNYPALRSLGKVALLGSVTCLLTALTLVPALMARRGRDESRG